MSAVLSRVVGLLRRNSSVALVAIVGCALSVAGAAWEHHNHQRFVQELLQQRAAHEAARLQKDIARAQEVLASLTGLFAASETVDRAQFRAFTAASLAAHREFQAIEWLPRVPDTERAVFEAALDKALPGRAITERSAQGELVAAARRAEYFPILFAEPVERNADILGFDAASRPEALDAMARARDSGKITGTSSITLIQGSDRKQAIVLYAPIYRNGEASDTTAARRASLAGYAVGVLLYGELLENSLAGSIPTGLDWLLFDLAAPAPDKPLYFHPSRTRGEVATGVPDPAHVRAGPHYETAVELPGREWRLLFGPSPAFDAEVASRWRWIILFAGLVLTGLLAAHMIRRARHGHELRAMTDHLRDSESRYRTLVASSPVVIYRARADGDFGATYVSPNVMEQMKMRPEQLTGNSSFWADNIHPDDRPRVFRELATLFEHGSHEHEYRFMFGDGTYHWIHDRLTLRRDEQGNPIDIVGAWLDVTARKQAEMALRHSEREWADAMDSFSDVVYVLDTNRRLVRANRAFFDMVGSRPDALLGRHIAGIVHPQGEAEPCPVCQAQEELRDAIITMESDHPDNPSARPLEITVRILRDERQVPSGILMSLHDLTHERQARARLAESEANYRVLFETLAQGVVYQDAQGRIISANPAAERILDLSLDQMQNRTSIDPRWRAIHEDGSNFPGHSHPAMAALSTGRPVRDVVMGVFHPRENTYRWILIDAIPQFREGESTPFQVYTTFTDITARKQAEEDLRLAAVTFQSHEGIMITDADAHIIRVNRAFEEITGYRAEEVIGQNPRMLQSGRHDAAFYQAMWAGLREAGQWSGEIWDRRKNGDVYPKFMTITAVRDEKGKLSSYVAVFTDISLRKQTEEEIHQLAFFDPLTRLPNRRLFLDRLRQTMAASHRSGRHGALLMLDLDHFKTINDTLGHALGDLLLNEVADRLKAAVREGDTVARFGGDEFVMVLEGLSTLPAETASQAEHVAEKIRAALALPYRLKEHEHHGTASIGISLFLGHGETESDLLRHADVALYQAKAAGRNAIRFYDPQMQAVLDQRTALEADLRHALGKQEFVLHYQVQVDSRARPLGAEALLRWQHPKRGFVDPDHFIPLAEESGLIVPIGLWVLEKACTQLVAWQGDPVTRELTLAVNVSARQFRQADFAAKVRSVLQASAANPARLKLELTESAVLENIDDAVEKMRALQELGVAFALDDFGTGHSSLSYLKRLPLAQIKIDRSFVRDIATDPNDAAIVNTIIAMSRTLGLNVIAEGVETEAQRDFLDSHGCHEFQGYLFGRPVPLEQFEANRREPSAH